MFALGWMNGQNTCVSLGSCPYRLARPIAIKNSQAFRATSKLTTSPKYHLPFQRLRRPPLYTPPHIEHLSRAHFSAWLPKFMRVRSVSILVRFLSWTHTTSFLFVRFRRLTIVQVLHIHALLITRATTSRLVCFLLGNLLSFTLVALSRILTNLTALFSRQRAGPFLGLSQHAVYQSVSGDDQRRLCR